MKTRITQVASPEQPFLFQDGSTVDSLSVAWNAWGSLSPRRDNVILLFPVLTTSHHAAGFDREGAGGAWWNPDCYQGWWDSFIGPGKALDTNRWMVICASFIGGCYGSTGPSSIDPKTGDCWGDRFPYPQISDLVDAQVRLLDQLNIQTVHAVVGASFGGYLALDFALRYAHRTERVVSMASGLRVTEAMKLSNFQQIMAIESHINAQLKAETLDTYPLQDRHCQGLAVARMIAMQQYIVVDEVETYCRSQVDKRLQDHCQYPLRHPVESWLLYQGKKFTQRFDRRSYLRLLHAWQNWHPGLSGLEWRALKMLNPCQHQQWLLFSIDSDACFPPQEQLLLADALGAAEIAHDFVTVSSRLGHDSFLREPELYQAKLSDFLGVRAHSRSKVLSRPLGHAKTI